MDVHDDNDDGDALLLRQGMGGGDDVDDETNLHDGDCRGCGDLLRRLPSLRKTHCKEAWNLSTAPFHGLYFRFSHIYLSPYGFCDHLRMPSDSGCYHTSNRLGLNSIYYQKSP